MAFTRIRDWHSTQVIANDNDDWFILKLKVCVLKVPALHLLLLAGREALKAVQPDVAAAQQAPVS